MDLFVYIKWAENALFLSRLKPPTPIPSMGLVYYLHLVDFYGINVGTKIPYTDAMGLDM